MTIIRFFIHYGFHFIVPGLLAFVFFKSNWRKAWLMMICTMLVDMDHLFANPVFDANRCSIGFHVLHSYVAIACYTLLLFFPRARIIASGLLFHMFTDYIDCLWL
jgi:Family of unknown function (DUF6122)